MIFSRKQLDQLAKSNGYSINKLIAQRKQLSDLELKKVKLQKEMKDILSSSDVNLPVGSSLLLGTINTQLLTSLGYEDINALIKEFEETDNNITKLKKDVVREDEKIKASLSILKDVDITKEMEDQITQEVLLDSDLAEVRNNSQEILLMLSQSKNGGKVLKEAMAHTKVSEQKLADYLLRSKGNVKANNKAISDSVTKLNNRTSSVNERLSNLTNIKEPATLLDKLNSGLSNLSPTAKNGLLGVTFLGFTLLGLSGGKSKETDKDKVLKLETKDS